MATTIADYMVATLKATGVRRVYGIPGDSLNGFTDALRRDGEIAWQHVRHEEAAAFAAAAEAAVTGELAVCAGSWSASRTSSPACSRWPCARRWPAAGWRWSWCPGGCPSPTPWPVLIRSRSGPP